MPDRLAKAAESIHEQLAELTPAMERHRATIEKADRRSKVGIIVGVVGIVVAIVASLYALSARETAEDVQKLQEEFVQERTDTRVAGCIQYNVQRESVKLTFKHGILALVPATVELDELPEKLAVLTPSQRASYDRYAGQVDRLLPLRDCSPGGIDKYLKDPPPDPATVIPGG